MVRVNRGAWTTDSQSLMIKTENVFSQSSNPPSLSSVQWVYGEVSGKLYWGTISYLNSWSCNTQVINKIKFNGVSTPTVEWSKYFTVLTTQNYANIGVMHNENYIFAAYSINANGILLKIDASNGNLAKSWQINGESLSSSTNYNHLVTDSSDSYLLMHGGSLALYLFAWGDWNFNIFL